MGGATATSADLCVGDTTGGDLQFNIASGDTFAWNYDTTFNQNVVQFRGLKKKPKVSESIRRLENPWLWTSATGSMPNYYSQLANEAKSQQERNKFVPIVPQNICYKSRKCGQATKMRMIVNIALAQGKKVVVISNDPSWPYLKKSFGDRTPKDHMDDLIKEYNRRPTITIRLKRKVGYIKFKNGSTIYMATDEGEYKHVTGHSTKLLSWDYSPWTSNNDMNGNDIADVGSIRFNNTGEIKWRDEIEDAPMDIISSANRAYALESLRDESRNILDECTGFDDINLASGIPTSNLMIDTDGINTWLSKPLLVTKRSTINISLKGKIIEDEEDDDY